MIGAISSVIDLISSPAKAIVLFSDLLKKNKGDVRALVEEMKENLRLCNRVRQDRIDPSMIIPRFSTKTYDRLNEEGFDFNKLKRGKIRVNGIENTSMASWSQRESQDLIVNIYDKIKDIRSLYELSATENRRFGPRIINISNRIILLFCHIKS